MGELYNLKRGVAGAGDLSAVADVVAPLYLDTVNGATGNNGSSWGQAFKTMTAALAAVQTGGSIYFRGDVREECVGSNLVFDVKIIGVGGAHHADLPSAAYHPGASVWRPPASPTTATPLLKVRGRGWEFHNILFDCPVDAAAVYLERNALSGTSEYDSSHAKFFDCRFESGLVGIQNAGGASFVLVEGCRFYRLTESGGAGIKCTSTSVAVPLNWRIQNCHFMNNASHILSSMSYSEILNSVFGRFTATLSVDLYDQPSASQGEYNVITGNYLGGTYSITAYPAGSNNEWAGNQNVAGVTTADPTS